VNTTTRDLDKTLHTVQSLIAKADSTDSPHEADALRAKAEAMMLKYRIDESMLAQSSTGSASNNAPVWRTIRVCMLGNEFHKEYRTLMGYCLRHVDCRSVWRSGYVRDEDGRAWYEAEAVGYDTDLRYAEMLFTSFALAFAGKMEPKVNPSLTDEENAYTMRSAGMEGWRISEALWGRTDKAARSKARKLFAKAAAAKGEDASALLGQGNSVKVFRASYGEGFVREAYSRLWRMRMSGGDTGALVLKDRREAIDEAFYAKYPNLRPNPNAGQGLQLGGRDICEKCRKAVSGYCRDHAYLRPSRAQYKERAINMAGYERGQMAASTVSLGASGRQIGGE
jgi:hypothetical protein